MAMLQDDSNDEITCCYRQLEERLRINRSNPRDRYTHLADHRSNPRDHRITFDSINRDDFGDQRGNPRNHLFSWGDRSIPRNRGMSAKDLKQLSNQQRKHFQDEQSTSSSSSSLDMYNDPTMPGPSSSAYGFQNKKRQNGDKSNGQLVNSKRTCLDEEFQSSPSLLDYKKPKKNGVINHSRKNTNLTTEPISSSSRNLLPGHTYEEHKDDSSECSDVIPFLESGKPNKTNKQPKHSSLLEVPPPSSIQCLDSTSEDGTRMRQTGALKGGRQSPDPTSNKGAMRRKIRRVLSSDDSDSEDWPVGYRARPVVFSSSDSEDSEHVKKLKSKLPPGGVSKKQDLPSGPTSDSQTLGLWGDPPPTNSFLDQLVDIAGPPNHSNGPPRSQLSSKSRGVVRRRPDPSVAEGPSNLQRTSLGGSRTPPKAVRTSLGASRTPPSARLTFLRDQAEAGIQPSLVCEQSQVGAAGPSVPSSSRLPTEPPSFLRYAPSRRSRKDPHSPNICRRRGGRRVSRRGSSILLPSGMFEHEDNIDSSDLEFFTANSYSDTESNTESLGRRVGAMGGNFPPEMRSNPSINVGSSEEDEISVVYTGGPSGRSPRSRTEGARRRAARTLGRRYNRRSRRILPQRPGVSLSPDPVEQVRQVEEDERFARVLQAQFDAEVDPPYIPRPHSSPNPCLMNIREASSSEESLDVEDRGMDLTRGIVDHIPYRTQALYNNLVAPRAFHGQRLVNPFLVPRNLVSRMNHHLHHPMLDHITFNEDSFEALLGLAELNGDVTRGLQKSQINRLPTRKFAILSSASTSTAELPHKRAELNKECQVCLNDYVNGDVLRILPCFHEFHTPCIDPWLKINHTCPVCRVVVDFDE